MVENRILSSLDLFYNINDNIKEDVLSFYLITEFEYNSKFEIDNLRGHLNKDEQNSTYLKKYKFYKYIFEKAKNESAKYDYLKNHEEFQILRNKMGKYPVVNLGKLILNEEKYGNLKDKKLLQQLNSVSEKSFFLKDLLEKNKDLNFKLAEKFMYSSFLKKCFSLFYDIDYEKVKEIIAYKNNYIDSLIGLENHKMVQELNLLKEYLSPKNICISTDVYKDKHLKKLALKIFNNELLKIDDKKEWLIALMEEGLNKQAVLLSNRENSNNVKVIENFFNEFHAELSNFLEIEQNDNEIVFKVNIDKLSLVLLTYEVRKLYTESNYLNSQKMYTKTLDMFLNMRIIGSQIISDESHNKMLETGVTFLDQMGILNITTKDDKIFLKNIGIDMKFEAKKMIEKAFADVIPSFYINGVTRSVVSVDDLLLELAKDLNEKITPGFEKIAMKNDIGFNAKAGLKKVKKF